MGMTRIVRLCCVLAAAALLSSCATPYQSKGPQGGYHETRITEGEYAVVFNGNQNTSRNRVYFFWVYRCAELTLQQGYSLYVVHPKQSNAWNPTGGEARMQPALYTADSAGELIKTRGGGTTMIFVPGVSGAYKLWTYTGTINMYRNPLPEDVLWAVDAQQTVNLLKPYVTSNGNTKPPSIDDLFRKAFVAHAQISVGGGASVEVDKSPDSVERVTDAATATPNAPPRSVDDIADALAEARLLALHAMYRYYVTHMRPANPTGDVVLEFSVSPTGRVRECRVVSSTISDRGFTDAVATLVKQTAFEPKKASVTLVKDFHIAFSPVPVGAS